MESSHFPLLMSEAKDKFAMMSRTLFAACNGASLMGLNRVGLGCSLGELAAFSRAQTTRPS